MPPATAWYFAYADNMSRAQMRARGADVLEEDVARLENYELLFNKKARGGSATANIHHTPGKFVIGVLYKIPEAAFRSLDRFEGVPEHYRRIEVNVSRADGSKVPAQAYIATKVEAGLRPARHYLQIILVGAAEHSLPADYVAQLQSLARS